ncbi:unnamed protein product, partial [Closterium sp. NIES-64]
MAVQNAGEVLPSPVRPSFLSLLWMWFGEQETRPTGLVGDGGKGRSHFVRASCWSGRDGFSDPSVSSVSLNKDAKWIRAGNTILLPV